MSDEITRAIEAHERKRRKFWLKIILIAVGVCALGFGALYGCACMMSAAGQCP